MHKPSTCLRTWANFMRDKLWVWRTSSKTKISVLLKLDSLSTIRNKMIAQGEKLETSAKLRVFFIESIVAAAIYEIRLFVSRISPPLEQRNIFIFCSARQVDCMCSKKFEGVYLIKDHRNSLLFGYYKLGFRCLQHSLFSHCFDLKDLNLNKRFEPLRKYLLFTRPNVPIVSVFFTLPDQTAAS